MRTAAALLACTLLATPTLADRIRLADLDISTIDQEWGTPHKDRSVKNNPLRIGGERYRRGIGTHANSEWVIKLNGTATRFKAKVGLDDEEPTPRASVRFIVLGDGKQLFRSEVHKTGTKAQAIDVDVKGVQTLVLITDEAGDGIFADHANWVDGEITYSGAAPKAIPMPREEPYILTPKPLPTPKINGPTIFGVRPGSPILYTVPATGVRPMKFAASNLPEGAEFDAATGRLSGAVSKAGTYPITLTATNAEGTYTRTLKLVVGDKISLTPPMGWNSWNCFAHVVSEKDIRATADIIVSSGLINHGWTYVNIDDFWQNQENSKDTTLQGPARDANGRIVPNKRFPDMKGLADYVHSKGLKIGLYSSPGTTTCGGCFGSYQHEAIDADTYAEWGYDYLKYDWCSYGGVFNKLKDEGKVKTDLQGQKDPYILMGKELARQKRDIVYSLCQYGMGDVWEWGGSVGGQAWRTTGDITDTWRSMFGIGFGRAMVAAAKHSRPGEWNDPDMLIVGHVGWGDPHPTRLTPNEQYTHISLWCLQSAPLLIGCDMTKLDEFTLNLLTNDEVIAVNQDELGLAAEQVFNENEKRIWMKKLSDGSYAVGLFNTGYESQEVEMDFAKLGLPAKATLRDLWRQKDLGEFQGSYKVKIPRHGCMLLKVR